MRSYALILLGFIGIFASAPAKANYDDTSMSSYIGVSPDNTPALVSAPAQRVRANRHGRFAARAQSSDARAEVQSGASDLVAVASRYIGARNPTGFRGPWCKAFANMVARKAGRYVQGSLRARDTGAMGQRISGPAPGAYRVTRGHVSIVAAVQGGSVVAISGNNGHGRVGWSHYAARGAAYYMPI